MRALASAAMYSTSTPIQLVSVAIVIIGVYLISQHALTMGALIASGMLSSCALAPISGVNLVGGFSNDNQIVSDLLARGKLVTDGH